MPLRHLPTTRRSCRLLQALFAERLGGTRTAPWTLSKQQVLYSMYPNNWLQQLVITNPCPASWIHCHTRVEAAPWLSFEHLQGLGQNEFQQNPSLRESSTDLSSSTRAVEWSQALEKPESGTRRNLAGRLAIGLCTGLYSHHSACIVISHQLSSCMYI